MLLRKDDIFSSQVRDVFSSYSKEEYSGVINTIKTLVHQVINTSELVSKLETTILANEQERANFLKTLSEQGKSPEEIQKIFLELDKITKSMKIFTDEFKKYSEKLSTGKIKSKESKELLDKLDDFAKIMSQIPLEVLETTVELSSREVIKQFESLAKISPNKEELKSNFDNLINTIKNSVDDREVANKLDKLSRLAYSQLQITGKISPELLNQINTLVPTIKISFYDLFDKLDYLTATASETRAILNESIGGLGKTVREAFKQITPSIEILEPAISGGIKILGMSIGGYGFAILDSFLNISDRIANSIVTLSDRVLELPKKIVKNMFSFIFQKGKFLFKPILTGIQKFFPSKKMFKTLFTLFIARPLNKIYKILKKLLKSTTQLGEKQSSIINNVLDFASNLIGFKIAGKLFGKVPGLGKLLSKLPLSKKITSKIGGELVEKVGEKSILKTVTKSVATKEITKKVAEKSILSKVTSKISSFIPKGIVEKVGIKGLSKFLPKFGKVFAGRGLVKKLPIIGTAIGGVLGIKRLLKGDVTGAGLEFASGLATMLPFGFLASSAIDAINIARDLGKEKITPKVDTSKLKESINEIEKKPLVTIDKIPEIKPETIQPKIDVDNLSKPIKDTASQLNQTLINYSKLTYDEFIKNKDKIQKDILDDAKREREKFFGKELPKTMSNIMKDVYSFMFHVLTPEEVEFVEAKLAWKQRVKPKELYKDIQEKYKKQLKAKFTTQTLEKVYKPEQVKRFEELITQVSVSKPSLALKPEVSKLAKIPEKPYSKVISDIAQRKLPQTLPITKPLIPSTKTKPALDISPKPTRQFVPQKGKEAVSKQLPLTKPTAKYPSPKRLEEQVTKPLFAPPKEPLKMTPMTKLQPKEMSKVMKYAQRFKISSEVHSAIQEASKETGIDLGFMYAMAAQESGFNPMAQAKTSSAKGLYQFTNATWKAMVKKYGKQYGITMEDRFDPRAQALMGALYAKENKAYLEKHLGREVTPTDLYMAHFLGPAGAKKFLKAMQENPDLTVEEVMGSRVVKANPFLRGKTVGEAYQFFQKKIGARSQAFAQLYGTPEQQKLAKAMEQQITQPSPAQEQITKPPIELKQPSIKEITPKEEIELKKQQSKPTIKEQEIEPSIQLAKATPQIRIPEKLSEKTSETSIVDRMQSEIRKVAVKESAFLMGKEPLYSPRMAENLIRLANVELSPRDYAFQPSNTANPVPPMPTITPPSHQGQGSPVQIDDLGLIMLNSGIV